MPEPSVADGMPERLRFTVGQPTIRSEGMPRG
jgi:hypothetical protein